MAEVEKVRARDALPPAGQVVLRAAIPRPRLERLLMQLSAAHSVLEVVAAAGSGKTTLIQMHCATSDRRAEWVTLGEADRSGPRLSSRLEAARERVVAELDRERSAHGAPAAPRGIVVVDDAQEIVSSSDARAALAAFIDEIPPGVGLMMLTRESLDLPVSGTATEIARLGGVLLNLTRRETEDFVGLLGHEGQDPDDIHASTAGWVTGVCLLARSGLGSRLDTRVISEYLARQVLTPLPDDERRFLVDTSVAAEVVTPQLATALFGPFGERLWARVRERQLPATTVTTTTITYHPVFRGFLRQQLAESLAGRENQVRERYAQYVTSIGRFQEAADVWLALGRPQEALAAARAAVPALLDCADWPAILALVDSFDAHLVGTDPILLGAYLRARFGLGHVGQTRELVRRLEREGRLAAVIQHDPSMLAVAAWAMQIYPREALDLLDNYVDDSRAEVIRYATEVVVGEVPAEPPTCDDVETERHLSWGLFLQGRLGELAALRDSADESPVLNSNLVLGAAVRLDLDEAARLWDLMPPDILEHPHTAFVGGMLAVVRGDVAGARELFGRAAVRGRQWRFSLSPVYEIYVAYAQLLADGPAAAIDALEPHLDQMRRTGQRAYLETVQCILGMAYLGAARDADAQRVLADATASMTRSKRRLLLPLTAAMLAEAYFRRGDAAAAHASAELALEVSRQTGNLSALVRAVRMFPGIRQREMQRDPHDVDWARLLVTPSFRRARALPRPHDAELVEAILRPFGRNADLVVDGRAMGIGRTQLLELLAALALDPPGVDRDELQQRLFPDADQRNGGNRFRQLVHKLRARTGLVLGREENLVILPPHVCLVADDVESEWILFNASTTVGAERASRLDAALELVTGTYLPRSAQGWVEERRAYLSLIHEEARLELATLRLELGDPEAARDMCETVLAINRYSDSAYRLLTMIERRIGTQDSVERIRRRAAETLAEIGLRPGDARLLFRSGRHTRTPQANPGGY